ncbi:hypothetical protein FH972_023899 [Carpinus fangiana]|uniref:Uncharacterized protein n=1 Tax=Carpinus fangiana TaxID=176857 RepID=A0A5N6KWV5_9ROSI|nr:hypothetical protein FH972_023899 [Carpinus fangiana]
MTSTSNKTASTSSASSTPHYDYCTGEQAANGLTNNDFVGGLDGWTATSNSSQPNAVGTSYDTTAPDQDNQSAYMTFPKGQVTTATLSQTAIACATYVEAISFNYRLVKGGGCHIRASLPPLIDFVSVDPVVSDEWSFPGGVSQDFGPDQDSGSVVYTPLSVTVTCNGSMDSLIRLDYFMFGGIG